MKLPKYVRLADKHLREQINLTAYETRLAAEAADPDRWPIIREAELIGPTGHCHAIRAHVDSWTGAVSRLTVLHHGRERPAEDWLSAVTLDRLSAVLC